ncbi:MAG: DUF1491 family protein [Hyphomicrobiaceae bacterium]|nr:MAG: DUF1491 family protein [Hyphomicrobiaceae bacterium]
MRLKSGIWVMAYIRRLQSEGIPAAVLKRGDEDAGAIFIKIATLDGRALLFAPAPTGLEGAETERRWTGIGGKPLEERAADELLARERELDRDAWLIEIEDRRGRHFLDDWLAKD